jgi:sulfur-carrier protein
MSVTVRIPSQLRPLAGEAREVAVPAGSLREVIASLEAAHPGFAERLLDEHGVPRRFVTLFIGEEDARLLGGIEAPIPDGGTLSIVPAVAGG